MVSLAVSSALGQTTGTAAAPKPAAGNPSKPDIGASWDQLISTTIPQAAVDPALAQPQTPLPVSGTDKFLQHFFFETRTNFERYQTNFTGNPTFGNVIDAPAGGTFNPTGLPSDTAFQPRSNRLESFIDFGTRGYGSDRVNTHFAFRYRQDLTHVLEGAPASNVVETFHGGKLIEFLDATVEINGKPTDGKWAGTSLQVGRLNVYGAELASFDGASFTWTRKKYDATIFAGRRFSFFSDPEERGIGGANLNLKLSPSLSIQLETLWYHTGSNRAAIRKRWNDRWMTVTSFRSFGGSPTEFQTTAFYSAKSGKDSMSVGFFQKLTDQDYAYDYTGDVHDLAAKNPLYRLYLGPTPQYSQITVEARRQLAAQLRAGGNVVLRRLNKSKDQGPFDTSFEDYRFNAQYFPFRRIETFFEYHQRNSDRLSPVGAILLDDLSASGETSVKDMTGEVRRAFFEGRFSLSGGVYYRRISMQNQFFYIDKIHQSGVLGSAWVRFDRRTRAFFDYSLDNDFFLFRPDIKNSQMLRLGLNWKY